MANKNVDTSMKNDPSFFDRARQVGNVNKRNQKIMGELFGDDKKMGDFTKKRKNRKGD